MMQHLSHAHSTARPADVSVALSSGVMGAVKTFLSGNHRSADADGSVHLRLLDRPNTFILLNSLAVWEIKDKDRERMELVDVDNVELFSLKAYRKSLDADHYFSMFDLTESMHAKANR